MGKLFFNNFATVNVTNANSKMVNGLRETSMPGHALADASQPRSTEAYQSLCLLKICHLCSQNSYVLLHSTEDTTFSYF